MTMMIDDRHVVVLQESCCVLPPHSLSPWNYTLHPCTAACLHVCTVIIFLLFCLVVACPGVCLCGCVLWLAFCCGRSSEGFCLWDGRSTYRLNWTVE